MKQTLERQEWRAPSETSPINRDKTSEETSAPATASVRILLIEDNPDDQIFVRLCLEDNNTPFELHCVDNYEDGLAALKSGQWDAALVDYYLGGETGAELIRQAHSAGYATPCIMLTGTENEDIDQEAAESGAADYLPKDWLTPRELGRALQYALVSARSQQLILKAKQFVQSTVDALPLSIAVLDTQTNVIAVNETWKQFADSNDFFGQAYGIGMNYLEVCKSADERGDEYASQVVQGIKAVRAGEQEIFSMSYPCHSAEKKRWFMLRVTRFTEDGSVYLVVSHDNISATQMATEALRDHDNFLQAFVQAAGLTMWAVDANGVFTTASGNGIEYSGITGAEVVGHSIFDRCTAQPEILRATRSALGGARIRQTLQVGQSFFEIRCAPLCNEQGENVGATGMAIDLTHLLGPHTIES